MGHPIKRAKCKKKYTLTNKNNSGKNDKKGGVREPLDFRRVIIS